LGEIRQRDAELAALRAQAHAAVSEPPKLAVMADTAAVGSTAEPKTTAVAGGSWSSNAVALPSSSCTASSATPSDGEVVDVLTFIDEGPLGFEFDRANICLKVVASVEPGSSASGRLAVGDEVISIDGVPARSLSWEELAEALVPRPAVVSVRRAGYAEPRPGGTGAGTGTPLGLAGRVRHLAGWTRAAAKAAAREFEAAMTDIESTDEASAPGGTGVVAESLEDAEARNRPFYELVRTSMAEAAGGALRAGGPAADTEVAFERWLRNFHSERDDGWYTNNHTRVFNAFRPHWDEVVAAQRALAAS